MNLNPYKAQGPDNLSPRILKELADEISPLLQLIYIKILRYRRSTSRLAYS
jgi:hypothetical protein